MNRLHITLASLILFIYQVFLPPFSSANTADAVGTIPGAFSVGTDGAANYRIPLELPPGVNGLKPNLALEYDSQKGNGLLGIGWRLTGFPAINRCPTTLEQDGFIDGVDLDDNDKFCLNGQRLVAINGDYGANGTEYRTEHDSYKKIISYGAVGNGPAYFKVWYKNGEIAEFGNTDDARVEAQGKSDVLRWAINKTEDRFNNTINFNYIENSEAGEQYPSFIVYNNIRISFNYEKRPDLISRFNAGGKAYILRRLNTITITKGTQKVEYRLDYQQAGSPARSIVHNITRCADQCLPVTTFAWNNKQHTSPLDDATGGQVHTISFGSYDAYTKLSGDVNGDGLSDIIWSHSSPAGLVAYTALGLGNGQFQQAIGGKLHQGDFKERHSYSKVTGDFNGDGLTDLAWLHSTTKGLYAYSALSKGDGYFHPAQGGKLHSGNFEGYYTYSKLSRDINGDGLTDLVWSHSSSKGLSAYVALATGTGGFQPAVGGRLHSGDFKALRAYTKLTGDFNGDGLADLAWSHSTTKGLYAYIALGKGNGLFHPAQGGKLHSGNFGALTDYTKLSGDINGDGLTDLIWSRSSSSGLSVYTALAQGDGSFQPVRGHQPHTANFGKPEAYNELTGDFNGDGLTDLAWSHSSASGLAAYIALAKSDGTFQTAKGRIVHHGRFGNYEAYDKLPVDFNGDGSTDLAWSHSSGAGLAVYSASSHYSGPQLIQITNGLGHITKLTYKPLTNTSIFTKSTGSQYPVKDVQPTVHVVSEVKQANGIGGELTTQYHYKGLKRHQRGLGALGFAEITSTQVETGIKTTDQYLQDTTARKIGLLSRSQTWSTTGVLLKDTQQTWLVNTLDDGDIRRFQTHLASRVTQQKSLQDEWLSTLTETFRYDDWGSTTEAKQIIKDAYGEQQSMTHTTYQNDVNTWLLGLPYQAQVTKVSVEGNLQTRTTSYRYNSVTGALKLRIQEPGNNTLALQTHFKYDSFGNLIEEQTQGAKVATRKQTYTYDAEGRFLTSTTNALGHMTAQTLHPFWGVPVIVMDANGLVTTYDYDGFGRLTTQKAPDNTQTSITRGWCNGDTECPSGAVYWVKTQAQGSAPTTVYVDQLERTLRTETLALTGETQYQDTVYNALGQVEKSSLPYFKGDEVYWTTYEYDPLLRIVKTTQPDGTTSEVAYQGLNKVLTNAKGQTKTEHYNGAGQLVKVIDALGSSLSYTYDSFGNLTQTTDPDNNTVELTYDLLGRKVAMNDPDKGAWTYEYDALGRLIRQQDAKGQVTNLSYDTLDRLVKQTENAQASSKLLWRVSEFQYDQQHKGLLDQVTVDGITQQYQYDNLGRLTSETQTLFGESFTLSYSYDEYSRPLQTTFPTGLTAKQTYNERGYLTAITDGKASNATTYWQAQAVDALGNITQQQYGNGATTLRVFDAKTGRLQDSGAYFGSTTQIEDLHFAYDELGNLTQREDKRQKIQETFAYDQLNRLTDVTAQLSGNTLTTSVQYDALGNITHKSDVGDYRYAGKCGSQQAGPHALTKTTGSQNATYCYDANGNMTSGNGRTVRYTAFDKPDQIIRGDYQIDLVYGPDQKRVRRIDQGPTGTSTTYYQSGVYEKVVSDTGKIQHKHYIADVAIITKTENASTEDGTKTNYFHRDHLDSLTAITDQNGQVVERFSYDPWGKRRQTDWQAAIDFTQITSTITKRGFTNHEHLDGVGLIHMNGRVYDPNVGRFLSADPFVQFENYLQSYNRYSYGFNNPLNGTDPSGFSWVDTVSGWFGGGGKNDSGNDNKSGQGKKSDGYDYSLRTTLETGQADRVTPQSEDSFGDHHDLARGSNGHEIKHNSRQYKQIVRRNLPSDWAKFKYDVNQALEGWMLARAGDFVFGDSSHFMRDGYYNFALEEINTPEFQAAIAIGGVFALAINRNNATKNIGGYTVGPYSKTKSHHIIQDSAVRGLPGYSRSQATAVDLGNIRDPNSAHRLTRPAQRQKGGGDYAAERRIGYKALRQAGVDKNSARSMIQEADRYFESIGVKPDTVTRIPGDRR